MASIDVLQIWVLILILFLPRKLKTSHFTYHSKKFLDLIKFDLFVGNIGIHVIEKVANIIRKHNLPVDEVLISVSTEVRAGVWRQVC